MFCLFFHGSLVFVFAFAFVDDGSEGIELTMLGKTWQQEPNRDHIASIHRKQRDRTGHGVRL